MSQLARVLTGFFLCAVAVAAEPPARSFVQLINDSVVPGELRPSDDPAVLRWHSPAFAKPLEFPFAGVRSVHTLTPLTPPRPEDEYCFELAGDDFLAGKLLALTDDAVEIDSSAFGKLSLKRDAVRRLYRAKGADAVYLGPNGLAGWTDASNQWRDEAGQPTTEAAGAKLFANVGLPEKAAIEFELSWKKKPDFVLALGVDERDATAKYAFRFEVWDGELVVVGESNRDADVAAVQRVPAGEGSVRLQVYLDQKERKLYLLSRGGKPLATLKVGGTKPAVYGGVRLTNVKGDVRLEHLRVTRWNGTPPADARDQARLHRADGTIVYGRVAGYDPAAKAFVVRDGDKESQVPADAVSDVFLAPPAAPTTDAKEAAAHALRVACRNGARFSGTLGRVTADHLMLESPAFAEPLKVALADVRSLIPLKHAGNVGANAAGRAGRLEIDGGRIKGRLVASGDKGLSWQADMANAASPLVAGVSGRIVYKDPPPPLPVAKANTRLGNVVVAGEGMVIMNGAIVSRPQPVVPRNQAGGRKSLHLRTGDAIPCEVTHIDEKGVAFRTPLTDATFVPHEKIKSVELVPTRDLPALDEAKRDRLLTLPRMQKDSPPTHLIVSKNGDFLRGRITSMGADVLKVEVRLETKEIPRERVAQIIWLHADELTDAKPPAVAASDGTRAQAVQADGNRLTFVVAKADDTTVSGTSDVLGACRVNIAEVDQLLFGTSIEESAAKLTYHRWKLHPAPEPKFVSAEANGGDPSAGQESPLVGQPAPDFKLDLLSGGKFVLSEKKGRVVVLDFWATWCGPCMQAMPKLDELVREFADKGVDLIAVNMEEQPEAVKSMLERHKLKPTVVLDRDGAAAAKYAVTAIPQTVVIDREGKVARLYVGGGKQTIESLKQTLQALTEKK